jgi:hypothetical protein
MKHLIFVGAMNESTNHSNHMNHKNHSSDCYTGVVSFFIKHIAHRK